MNFTRRILSKMTLSIMTISKKTLNLMTNNVECRNLAHYAECCCAECRGAIKYNKDYFK